MRIGLTRQGHRRSFSENLAESARQAFPGIGTAPQSENGHGTWYRARFGISAKLRLRIRLRGVPVYADVGSADFLLSSPENQRRAASDQNNAHCTEQQIAHRTSLGQNEAFFVDDVGIYDCAGVIRTFRINKFF